MDRLCGDGWGKITLAVRTLIGKIDDIFVDQTLVDGTGHVAAAGGWVLRRLQTGVVQQYLIFVFLTITMALIYWG